MPHKMFFTSDTNPNDTTGGGGCICDPEAQRDCLPPYLIFPGQSLEGIASPHVVACYECLRAGAAACLGEIGGAGEDPNPTRVLTVVPEPATVIEGTWTDEDGPRI